MKLYSKASVQFEEATIHGEQIHLNFCKKDILIYASPNYPATITPSINISILGDLQLEAIEPSLLMIKENCIYNRKSNTLTPMK
ncbi:hypothetical protein [Flammeovirga agarivorans]|uniref:Uncharacterized protein n=1 Tax=Flammeovirga agarivorans TaxID=2726742 RepID=A0A7X8SG93_9BACT|nr:hypothetical protein [Flammeovirga agarivorans]NLR89588.1 hypothetical protein [Flammeovirga agarivorans]